MHKVQIQELTIDADEQLRATYRLNGGPAQTLAVDLYLNDDVRDAVRRLHTQLMTLVGRGAEKCGACSGVCCTAREHNEVDLTGEEAGNIAGHLGVSLDELRRGYLLPMHSTAGDYQLVFVETKLGMTCPFFDVDLYRCKVYEARPLTCRAFSADACDMFRPVTLDPGRLRWNQLFPAERLVRRKAGWTVEEGKAR